MSRWGVEIPPRDAFFYVLDPETQGEPPSAHERDEMVQDIARAHVGPLRGGAVIPPVGRSTVFMVSRLELRRPRFGCNSRLNCLRKIVDFGASDGGSGRSSSDLGKVKIQLDLAQIQLEYAIAAYSN
jgi:hypothetical protein